jgi:hypothetical protein
MRFKPSLALLALALAAVAPRTAWADDVFALDLSGTRPALAVSIAGAAPELWVFDTGAGGSVINLERAQALGLPEGRHVGLGSPAGGTPVDGFLTRLNGASIGAVTLPEISLVAAPALLPDRVGVLSPNIFAGRLVVLDFARNQLRIAEKTATNTPSGAATPYFGGNHHGLPAIAVSVGGAAPQMAHMDSGAPGGLTFPYAMAASLPLAAAPVESGRARFVDGEHARYRATLQGVVQVGPLTLTNPEIELIDGLPFLNVGMGLLGQMIITLDPAARLVWAAAAPDAS